MPGKKRSAKVVLDYVTNEPGPQKGPRTCVCTKSMPSQWIGSFVTHLLKNEPKLWVSSSFSSWHKNLNRRASIVKSFNLASDFVGY